MRRTISIVVALGLLAVLGRASRAGDDPAAAIIEKAIKAHFPKGLDTKTKGVRTKTKGTLHIAGLALDFTQEVTIQVPNKFKETMDLTVMGKNVTVATVFDGKKGWILADGKDVKVTDEILAEFKEVAYSMGLVQGMFLKDKSVKFSVVGDAQVKGKAAVGVNVSRQGKKDLALYFDKATGLLTKVQMRKLDLMSGQEVTEERFITEYQDVADRKVAKKVEVLRDGKQLLEAEVTDVQLLDTVDDSEFAPPK
jgi:hypothetical protein